MEGGAVQEARKHPRRGRWLPGDEGVWFFIAADMVLFAMLFGSFCSERTQDVSSFNAAQSLLSSDVAALNTIFLLTSSWLVARAVHLARDGALAAARRHLVCAMMFGGAFVVTKIAEYWHEIRVGVAPGSDPFFMFYFVVTGIHFVHVLGGLVVLLFLCAQLGSGELFDRRVSYLESGATFWHMVDLLWLMIFPLFYLLN